MTADTDPRAFALARLAEEEADARAATSGPWIVDNPTTGRWQLMAPADSNPEVEQMVAITASMRPRCDEDARHIARQDPPNTLARVAALRALVDAHTPEEPYGRAQCGHCADGGERAWPCDTLRAVDNIWPDHPDFDLRWKL